MSDGPEGTYGRSRMPLQEMASLGHRQEFELDLQHLVSKIQSIKTFMPTGYPESIRHRLADIERQVRDLILNEVGPLTYKGEL